MNNINEVKSFLFDYFKSHSFTIPSISSLLKHNKDIDDYCCDFLSKNPQYESKIKLIKCIYNNINLPKCLTCGSTLTYTQYIHGGNYCNYKCSAENLDRQIKVSTTFLNKYGGTNSFNSKPILEKIKQTNIEKYGVDNVFKSEKIQSDIKKANIEKYGVTNHSQRKIVQDKRKQTNLQKYGFVSSLSNGFVKHKIKSTLLEKYNTCDIGSKTIQECVRKTRLLKYGFGDLNLHRSYNNFKKFSQFVIPLFSEQEYVGYYKKNKNVEYLWKCVKCGQQFKQRIYHTSFNKQLVYLPRCLNCYPFVNGYSILEKELSDYIKSIYIGEIIENDRTLINPYELDIVIPEKKIAIEFDGLYWHSDLYKQSNYHLMKTEMCEQQGYKLIHIFEDEWINKQEIIKNKLKSILGIDQVSIYARKCYIKEIDNTIKNQFLNQNHVQGEDKSSIKLGLYYGDLLVAVMTFGKSRFNKNYQYELIRYATLSGYRVIGGAGKLLKYFERMYHPDSIITYADRRYSQGNMYLKLGFMFSHNSKPNLFYIKGNDIRFNRIKFQKHKLKNILGDKFDNNLSEQKNMKLNGWNKIYDCGNMVFIKIKGVDYE